MTTAYIVYWEVMSVTLLRLVTSTREKDMALVLMSSKVSVYMLFNNRLNRKTFLTLTLDSTEDTIAILLQKGTCKIYAAKIHLKFLLLLKFFAEST